VTLVSWFDAARFANWLQNGQPTGGQGAGTTETGAYTLSGATSGVFVRNPDATFGLPSENEWYKAAYYDASLNAGAGGYWLYPTRSDFRPNSRFGSATDSNSANYCCDDHFDNGYNGGYAVNNSTNWLVLPTKGRLTAQRRRRDGGFPLRLRPGRRRCGRFRRGGCRGNGRAGGGRPS
jgi:hypothetical protein